MAGFLAELRHTNLRYCRNILAASARSTKSVELVWAHYRRPWHEIPRSVLGWRTAATARQRRSDVDPFCYA